MFQAVLCTGQEIRNQAKDYFLSAVSYILWCHHFLESLFLLFKSSPMAYIRSVQVSTMEKNRAYKKNCMSTSLNISGEHKLNWLHQNWTKKVQKNQVKGGCKLKKGKLIAWWVSMFTHMRVWGCKQPHPSDVRNLYPFISSPQCKGSRVDDYCFYILKISMQRLQAQGLQASIRK